MSLKGQLSSRRLSPGHLQLLEGEGADSRAWKKPPRSSSIDHPRMYCNRGKRNPRKMGRRTRIQQGWTDYPMDFGRNWNRGMQGYLGPVAVFQPKSQVLL